MIFSSLLFVAGIFGISDATNVDPSFHGKCVGWVNKMRAKEGLPALQQWKDFERCADMTADRDSRKGVEYWSYGRGIFCDWAPYAPTAQLTCERDGEGEGAIEGCVSKMWAQKEHLKVNPSGELECNSLFGADVEQCAYGYLVMRGGHKGYNIYDRVACGLHETDDGKMWINLIFGRGEKVQHKMLRTAENWQYAPDGWDRKNFQPYGFACGGDKNTHPHELLVEDCADMESGNMYEDCTGEYDHDYRYLACGGVAPSPEPTLEPSMEPTATPTESPTSFPTQSPTSEPTVSPTSSPTSAPTSSPSQQPTPAPTQETTEPGPEQVCAAVSSKSVCKVTSGCYFGEDAEGPCSLFSGACEDIADKKTCKSAEPCVLDGGRCISKAASTPNPTPSPTSQPTVASCDIESKSECKRTAGCTYGKKGPCHVFTLTCADITASRSICGNTYGCVWKNSRCQDSTDISPF